MTTTELEATLRLWKALPVADDADRNAGGQPDVEGLRRGFVLTEDVAAAHPDALELVDRTYGRNGERLNQSFHKTWARVRNTSLEQLVIEQLIHYITTYSFEACGIYDQDSVYIPREALDAPELDDPLNLVVIRGLTRAELQARLMDLLTNGAALSEQTVADAVTVARHIDLPSDEIQRITNKEVGAALYDATGTVPGQPAEFLRFVIYRATGSTLLIKNRGVIDQLKERDNGDLVVYFDRYDRDHGLAALASSFHRFKPIFLALRTNPALRQRVNRLRRLAVTHHRPMPADVLNTVTAQLAQGRTPDGDELDAALAAATTFRKIRLAYALKFRTTDADSVMYRIRNGRSWAQEFAFDNKEEAARLLGVVQAAIVDDVRTNVAGRRIFIPGGLVYGLPATERQFTGHLPSGTHIAVPHDMVAGVHWDNVGAHRIDLDLSVMDADVGKIGWNTAYRTRAGNVLFSGDMTDAPPPHGASELMYFGADVRGVFIMFVNYYNFRAQVPVPYQIVVAQQQPDHPTRPYTVDPNAVVALSNATMTTRQTMLGIVVADDSGIRFTFAQAQLGRGSVADSKPYVAQARKWVFDYYTDTLSLNDVLVAAGAELVEDPATADIDLSPAALDKATVLDLLRRS